MSTVKPEQVVEIIVEGDLTFPQIVSASLAGKSISLSLTDAKIASYSALVGNGSSSGPRPSQRAGKDHVRITVKAGSLTIKEVEDPQVEPVTEF